MNEEGKDLELEEEEPDAAPFFDYRLATTLCTRDLDKYLVQTDSEGVTRKYRFIEWDRETRRYIGLEEITDEEETSGES